MTQHESTATVLRKNKKVLIASLTGSSIEWFDYFLYGTAAALVFNKIFFPMVDPVIGLILSYLSFSLTLRVCARKTQRLLRQYSAGGRYHRHVDGDIYRLANDAVQRRGFSLLGLAHSVPAQFRAGNIGALDSERY